MKLAGSVRFPPVADVVSSPAVSVGPEGVAFPKFIGPKRPRKGTPEFAPPGALGGAWDRRPGRPRTDAKSLI